MLLNPKVAVLLACYNGAQWLEPQLRSILASEGVIPHIFLSDDGSTDGTVQMAQDICGDRLTLLPSDPQGSAGQNFIRLVLDAPWEGFDYVCLADQDDVWNPDKLMRAVAVLRTKDVSAYSSDITAFWPDGRRKYICKSQPQRRWDHLFEGAGPGNTFVWPISQAEFLRAFLRSADPAVRSQIALHDWAFFAIFRENGKSWHIDAHSGLEYRQHAGNVIGASGGLQAMRARFAMIRSDWYREQILIIAEIACHSNPVVEYLRTPTLGRIWVPFWHFRKCRRRAVEAILVALAISLMGLRRRD